VYPWWCVESFDDWHLHSIGDFVRAMRSEPDAAKLYPFLLHKFLFQKEAIVLITRFDPWDVSDPKALIRAFGKVMDLWYQ